MTNHGHKLTGLAGGIGLAGWLWQNTDVSPLILIGALVLTTIGASFPDRIEWAGFGKRWVQHRTWTHWWVFWVVPLALIAINPTDLSINAQALMAAFFFGGVIHLIGDLPNPTGIPLFTPYNHFSLGWWRSGEMEWLIVPSAFIASITVWWPVIQQYWPQVVQILPA